ncbi:5-methylcytosine-specific restriction endonuclease system specificity protein McrC [Romboutsia ilealis]|uniref:5-methylcytosine-specific restriction endonuclease system specificity protein McrC n=1 Tax=Romboutsia faecis TaxID=2764597 RepID=A0ABR7JK26_9FIRM|nr:5-methylcytosine-specific restriction endonuclease system specificity protein McrC [Romboutsia faecis]MBC5995276.1 5-methylcytosine-specific restriction endonuclease system specificity protein McrC [Romboutsia faecis]MRN24478.1 5-methylcytosine-specific restriction endonuclease system specificity protein McrC [Romboutsia ilealis]
MKIKDIPIQNIYYMLLYTWDSVQYIGTEKINKVEGNNLYELLASVLIKDISKLVKKGIYKEYKFNYEETPSLKGKINFDDSLKRSSFIKGRACCYFDEFTEDIIYNKILKATLYNILKSTNISNIIKYDAMKVYKYFSNVTTSKLTKKDFYFIDTHKNNVHYKLSLDICRLIYENMMIDESSGKVTFKDFCKDEKKMVYVFERFVRNFYKTHLKGCSVTRENIRWDAAGDEIDLLPIMQTDITIKNKNTIVIMDTKFYRNTLATNMNREKIYSSNLYQIFSYLKNAEAKGGAYLNSIGILLYPQVDRILDNIYDIQGHKIKVCSINLNTDWKEIHKRLIDICNCI